MIGKKRLNNRGDTIVEVLICITIISLVLTLSYATANHNARSIQDAQERSQAIQLAQRQIEFLKAHDGDTTNQLDTNPAHPAACYDASGAPQQSSGTAGSDECVVQADGQEVTAVGFEPAYSIQVTGDSTTQFTVNITWDSIVSNGRDNLTMYYRP